MASGHKKERISNTTIRRLSKKLGIHNPMQLSMEIVVQNLLNSKKNYEQFIPNARSERQRFYEELAAANAIAMTKDKGIILKNILNIELSRHQHATIRRYFPNKASISKKVDIIQKLVDGA